jgi:hypothetical protein
MGLAGLALAACETPATVQQFPDITFGHLPTIDLNAADVRIASEYQAPMQAPNVEHLFPVTPSQALHKWAEDRLAAKGIGNAARFTISDARVTETVLKTETGLSGVFNKEPAARYDASVAGMLEILDNRGFRKGFATARVSRSRSILEGASINERERMWFELVEAVMADFNAEMEKNIRAHVGAFVM